MFSVAERDRRFKAADDIMKDEGLSALLILGNGAVGTNSYGIFRYLVDNRTFYYIQAAIFAPGKEPVSIASSIISQLEFINKSFVKNSRVEPDPIKGIINTFKDMGITSGRVGTVLEMFPTSWFIPISEAFPGIEFVDITAAVFELRQSHSGEEVETFRKCAALADIGYETVCKALKPGMTEQELVAELEYSILKNGGEYNFTLITSGRFGFKENKLPFLHAATMFDKKIEAGDTVSMEITPRYNGYWTQLARTFSVGENKDVSEVHKVVVGAISDVLAELRPGNPISAIPMKIKKFTEDAGYTFALPCGHICGSDLNEERLEETNSRILKPGMAVILHPTVVAPGLTSGIFWGETYLITEDGCERLMKTGDELTVV